MPVYYKPSHLRLTKTTPPKDLSIIERSDRVRLVRKEENTVPFDIKVGCLPATVIFVHGVNSEGEWYGEAEINMCDGLNTRLGRKSIKPLATGKKSGIGRPVLKTEGANSPVLHFWWGYRSPSAEERAKYPGINLRDGKYWGGGPFQNGTTSLLELWGDGMQDLLSFIDPQRINPMPGRSIHRAPPRWYMVHAAQRLAFLIDEIRRLNPLEAITVVCHSQGNMIGLLAQLFTSGRPADTLSLSQPPYSLDAPLTVLATNNVDLGRCQTDAAREQTLINIVERIADKFQAAVETQNAIPESGLWSTLSQRLMTGWDAKPATERDNRGKVFLNFNVHDRVIGLSTVQGIGWQGVDDAFLKRMPANTFYQRAFAGGETVGGAPHTFDFASAKVGGQFWYPKPERLKLNLHKGEGMAIAKGATVVGGVATGAVVGGALTYNAYGSGVMDITNDPTPRRVTVNAPVVPQPVPLAKRNSGPDTKPFDKEKQLLRDVMSNDLHYAAEDTNRERVIVDYKIVNVPIFSKSDAIVGYRTERVPIYADETDAQRQARVGAIKVSDTDHGQILGNADYPEIVSQIIAYDIAIAPNIVHKHKDYWQYLRDLADWKVSDPYFHGQHILNREGLPPIPPEIVNETFQTKVRYFADLAYDAATFPARLPDLAAEQARRAKERALEAAGQAIDDAYEAGKDAVVRGASEAAKAAIRKIIPGGIPPVQ